MSVVYLKIYEGDNQWVRFIVDQDTVHNYKLVGNALPSRQHYKLDNVDGVQVHRLLHELRECSNCRQHLLNQIERKGNINTIKLKLSPLSEWPDTLDYDWNYMISKTVRERCELDNTLSWLSTLGGAFSALGDYYVNCAETAGRISVRQLELAVKLGDPNVAARCRLYFALSLIQKGFFGPARRIVSREYKAAKEAVVRDDRLLRMCLGIWSKLQYESQLHKKQQSKTIKNN